MAELNELIEREMCRPFVWGESDCCCAVCNILVAMGHDDPMAAHRRGYSDKAHARVVMAASMLGVAVREAKRLGWPEIDPDRARDGDIGIIDRTLAIFSGGWWIAKSGGGCILKRKARRAWRPV